MEKIDPYKNKERYEGWKETKKIDEISKENAKLIVDYVLDMENGMNIANMSKKGGRSYRRLNDLRDKMVYLTRKFESIFKQIKLIKLTENQAHELFHAMRTGKIKKKDKTPYKDVGSYVKVFKAFWHWHMKKSKKEGKIIEDITIDLDVSREKPKFVYLTEQEFRKLVNRAKYKYKVLMWFLFDSGIRSPTELINIRANDLIENGSGNYDLNIREEISKTFGRRIKLMLCSKMLKEYIADKNLKREDILFAFVKNPSIVNRYIKRLAKRILGKDGLTMYDFRHNSCCYWLPRYKSESALKYRFGWKKSEMIHYYTEYLGMKDTIQEEDLLIDEGKTEIEKKLAKERQAKELSEERFKALEKRWGALEEKMEKQNEAETQRRETLLKEMQELKELQRELTKYKEFFEALKERLRTRSTR